MDKGYLTEILQALSAPERAAFRKYLCSPYLNARQDVLALFDQLNARGDSPPQDRRALQRTVFPGQSFDTRQWNYTVSYLTKLAESFLAQREWEADPAAQGRYLLRSFRKRRLSRLAERARRAQEQRLEKQSGRGGAYFRQRYRLAFETLQGYLQQGRGRDFNVDALSEAHEKAFVCEKLKLGCMLQSVRTVAAREYEAGLLPVLLVFLQNHRWLEEPVIAAWYHGYHVQADAGASEHFEPLKTLIIRRDVLLPDEDRHDLFLLAVNFCIRRINSGQPAYSAELFDLYREGLEQGVFLEDGVLSRWSYNNIVNTALKMGQTDWALQFLEDYRLRLEPAFRDTNYFFNLARCRYVCCPCGTAGTGRADLRRECHRRGR